MIGHVQKNIIIRALCIRQERGERPDEILNDYKKLSVAEKAEILAKVSNYKTNI